MTEKKFDDILKLLQRETITIDELRVMIDDLRKSIKGLAKEVETFKAEIKVIKNTLGHLLKEEARRKK